MEQGRNFTNKIWNAFRLVKGWEVDEARPAMNETAIDWFEAASTRPCGNSTTTSAKFRISDALMTVYKLVWDDFCSEYLEMIKPAYQQPIDPDTLCAAPSAFLEKLLKVLHPFMPFITEEIWHELKPRGAKEFLIVAAWPAATYSDHYMLSQMELVLEAVNGIRSVRNGKGLPQSKALPLQIRSEKPEQYEAYLGVLIKLANLESVEYVNSIPEGASSVVVGQDEFFVVLEGMIDPEAERGRLEKELEYTRGFLLSVEKKLLNERFVQGAPETVLQKERQKQEDALSKIRSLEKSLSALAAS